MAGIVLDGISKAFGEVLAVDDVSLRVDDGEFMVLVGPSGCGKSTILRMIAGLEEVTAGEIEIGEEQVTDLEPKERDIAMVFQNYALYPHMSVRDNLGFGLKLAHFPKPEREERVREVAEILGLQDMMDRKPSELSGGQRQRVAIGRAMVREPKAFLMDEPLSNLDAKLRIHMRAELQRLHDRLGTTTVYVTHDQVEAMTLGDRVAVLRDGILQQVDTPQNLYVHPANLFVAAFIGAPPMNLVEATIDGDRLRFGGFEIPIPNGSLAGYDPETVIVGIRPADMEDADVRHEDDLPTIEVTADVTEELGSEVNVLFRVDAPPVATEDVRAAVDDEGGDRLLADEEPVCVFCARVDARTKVQPGRTVRLTVDPARFHYFDPLTGATVETASAARA
jgi:multiple sugar transport system ATP-binding protein